MGNPDTAIEARGLTKVFRQVQAVDGVDLTVPAGSIYGLLGPNGAGKSTLVRMLATLVRPDAGHARVLGYDLTEQADAIRARVSLTGQSATVDGDLTGQENLVLLARLLGYPRARAKARAEELLDAFGLGDAAGRQVAKYSGGMRRRLDIAASVVVTPELLFLDEPTAGLDPRSRNDVWQIVRALVANGCTVLLTTQYLEEADQLADRVAVLDQGSVIAEGTVPELKSSIGPGVLRLRLADIGRRVDATRLLTDSLEAPVPDEADPAALSVACPTTEQASRALTHLTRAGISLTDFALTQPSLDEVFLALTGTSTTLNTITEPSR